MVKTSTELGIKVKNARLLTKDELNEYNEYMPNISFSCCWWLADVDEFDDDYIAYAEGTESDDDMFCRFDEANTWVIAALDIESSNIQAGDEFIHCGYVFTALSGELAVSNNFLGCAKYRDDETGYGIDAIIYTMIDVDRNE